MDKHLEKVKEFHKSFKQPINNSSDDISLETRQLRIKLIFEELKELSEASDLNKTFYDLCESVVSNYDKPVDGDCVDKVEELDALCDLDYVLRGSILSMGHHDYFTEAFSDVHDSNMTKLCSNMKEVSETIDYYINNRGLSKDDITFCENGDKFMVNRLPDMKVLKNVNYKSVELGKYFN